MCLLPDILTLTSKSSRVFGMCSRLLKQNRKADIEFFERYLRSHDFYDAVVDKTYLKIAYFDTCARIDSVLTDMVVLQRTV